MLSTLRKLGATGVCVVSFLSQLSVWAGAPGPIQAQFSLLDSHTTNGPADGVALVGGMDAVHYLKLNPISPPFGWLRAIRAGDPAQLSLLGPPVLGGAYAQIRGSDSYLYSGDENGEFAIYSIQEPQGLVKRGSIVWASGGMFPGTDGINDIEVSGQYAYVNILESVRVLDVSNPAAPSLIRTVPLGSAFGRITTSGDKAFVFGNFITTRSGYGVLDIANPVSAQWLGSAGGSLGVVWSLRVSGNWAYAIVSDGLRILNVQDPLNPVVVGSLATRVTAPDHADLAISGSLVFVGGPGGLEVIDVSVPSQPVSIGQYAAAGGVARLVASGTTVHLAGEQGLSVVQVRTGVPQELHWSDAPGPVLALNIPYALTASATGGGPVQFRVESGPGAISGNELTVTSLGTVVVLASQAGDAETLSVEERRAFNVPEVQVRLAGVLDTDGSAEAVTLVNDRAYIADGTGGLVIADLANPDAPVRLGHYFGGGAIFQAIVDGSLAYLMGELGLEVVDVQDPANPVKKGGLRRELIGHKPTRLTGHGTRLAIGDMGALQFGFDAIVMVDVSHANAPTELGHDDFFGADLNVMDGSHSFLAWSDILTTPTLRLHDFRKPDQPQLAGNAILRAKTTALRLTETHAYAALGSTGLEVLDLGDFDSIRETATLGGLGETRDVDVAGDLAFMLSNTGIQVVEVGNPRSLRKVGSRELTFPVSQMRASTGRLALAAGSRGLQVAEYKVVHPQAVRWALPSVVAFPGTPIFPVASVSSGLSPSVSVVSGHAWIDGDRIVLTGVGDVVLRAVQAGNDTFLPVTSDWNLTVLPPALSVRANSGIDLTWASGVSGSKLQSSDTLMSGGSWHEVQATVEESEGKSHVHLAPSDRDLYFRLSTP